MKCSKYPDRDAAGFCAYSGKPYCKEELVEVYGKMVAKDNLEKFMEEMKKMESASKKDAPSTPMVFMNAGGGGGGGGGGAAASSSSSSAASGGGFFADVSCLDWILVFFTCGLWLIWMAIRPKKVA
ncbi:MAG: hypothetical protein NZM06_09465 [Chloroherpetonaceae bacterium]|nr:hypothetical protein [Chloroherpetonaceae bacterium]